MEGSSSKIIEEYQNKIEYLENKLENIVSILQNLIIEDYGKAKRILVNSKESAERFLLEDLIEKSLTNKIFLKSMNDKTYKFLKIIIESMNFPVFIKDDQGKYILINSQEANLFGLSEEDIIGKHDSDFVKNEEEMEIIRKSDEDVLTNNWSVELPNQKFSLKDGSSYVFKTHKIPFVNPITGKKNILGFSVDVTDAVNLQKLQEIVAKWNNPYL